MVHKHLHRTITCKSWAHNSVKGYNLVSTIRTPPPPQKRSSGCADTSTTHSHTRKEIYHDAKDWNCKNLRFEKSIIAANKPAIANTANGIQIPKISANIPLRNRKNVPAPN